MKIKKIFNDLISLLYPELCQACGNALFKNEKLICLSCLYKLPKTNFHLEKNNTIEKIFWGRFPLQKASSFLYFSKGGRVQNLMHEFKYRSNKEIGFYLGELFAKELSKENWFDEIDLIIPIPLHPKKQQIRGYNQSEEIANGFEKQSSVPVDIGIIKRIVASETQTKKSRFRRWENVKEIFQIDNPNKIEGKHILIIDDIITTGATLEACAQKLLSIDGVKISLASLAYTAI